MHGFQTLQLTSVTVLLALAAISIFRIWSTAAKLVYLQADEPLQRKIYISEPAVEFNLEEDTALQLINPLHVLSDFCDIWHRAPGLYNK